MTVHFLVELECERCEEKVTTRAEVTVETVAWFESTRTELKVHAALPKGWTESFSGESHWCPTHS
jgi:hypothetical protein